MESMKLNSVQIMLKHVFLSFFFNHKSRDFRVKARTHSNLLPSMSLITATHNRISRFVRVVESQNGLG